MGTDFTLQVGIYKLTIFKQARMRVNKRHFLWLLRPDPGNRVYPQIRSSEITTHWANYGGRRHGDTYANGDTSQTAKVCRAALKFVRRRIARWS